jgi:hypothetical protein
VDKVEQEAAVEVAVDRAVEAAEGKGADRAGIAERRWDPEASVYARIAVKK